VRQIPCPAKITSLFGGTVTVSFNKTLATWSVLPINSQSIHSPKTSNPLLVLIGEATYFCIPEERRPCLRKAKRKLVVAEAGRKMTTSGVADIKIQIGLLKFEWPIYVAPIGDDLCQQQL
jgi:hypothetical protein